MLLVGDAAGERGAFHLRAFLAEKLGRLDRGAAHCGVLCPYLRSATARNVLQSGPAGSRNVGSASFTSTPTWLLESAPLSSRARRSIRACLPPEPTFKVSPRPRF